ncbi:MAG: helix-turn-helix domain-containing protein [bacterium]
MVLGGIVRDVLTETDGNKAQAARILGIPKTTLYRRLERWHLLS